MAKFKITIDLESKGEMDIESLLLFLDTAGGNISDIVRSYRGMSEDEKYEANKELREYVKAKSFYMAIKEE